MQYTQSLEQCYTEVNTFKVSFFGLFSVLLAVRCLCGGPVLAGETKYFII